MGHSITEPAVGCRLVQVSVAILIAAGLSNVIETAGAFFVQKLKAGLHFLRRRHSAALIDLGLPARSPAACDHQALQGQPLQHVTARCEGRWVLEDLQAAVWHGDVAAMQRVESMLLAGYGAKQAPQDRRLWADAALAIQSFQIPGQQPTPAGSKRQQHKHVICSKGSHALAAAVTTGQVLLPARKLRQHEPELGTSRTGPSLAAWHKGAPLSASTTSPGTSSTDGEVSINAEAVTRQGQGVHEQQASAFVAADPQELSSHKRVSHRGGSIASAVAATLLHSCLSNSDGVQGHNDLEGDSLSEPSTEAGDSDEEEQEQQGRGAKYLGGAGGGAGVLEHMACVRRTRSAGALACLA